MTKRIISGLIGLLAFVTAAAAQVPNGGAPGVPNAAPSTGAGSGTVTSVGLGLPASVFSVSGSPVTGSGTLTGSFVTQSANTFFAGPTSGGAAVPAFRGIVVGDLPTGIPNANLANSSITIGSTAISLGSSASSIAGSVTFSGTVNYTGTFQVAGNSVTFPAAPATLTYQGGAFVNGDCLQASGTAGAIVDSGSTNCGAASAANPTATAGPTAVNGVATTFMRSDGAPAVQLGTAAVKGILQGDGTTLSIAAGVISINLSNPNTWAAAQTFNAGDLLFKNSGGGATTLAGASSASNFTVTVPAATDTFAMLGAANALTGNETHTGTEDFSGTTTPTMSAGHLFIGGIMTAPTFTANGQGAIFLTTGGGVIVQGQGSGADVQLLTHGGTTVCQMTSTGQFTCNGATNGFQHSGSVNGTAIDIFKNASTGASAIEQIQIGNNTSATEVTLSLNGGGNSGGNGTGSFTINNSDTTNTGGICLQTGGVNGFCLSKANAITLANALPVAQGGTGDTGTAWSTYTPTVTCSTSGTITSDTVAGRYKTIGKSVLIWVNVNISTLGTCLGNLNITLPGGVAVNATGATYPLSAYNASAATTVIDAIATSANGIVLPFVTAPAANNYFIGGTFESS